MRDRVRLPFKPLYDAARAPSLKNLADRLDVAYAHVKACQEQGLSRFQADRWAIKLHLHPGNVWGMEWWQLPELASPQERDAARKRWGRFIARLGPPESEPGGRFCGRMPLEPGEKVA